MWRLTIGTLLAVLVLVHATAVRAEDRAGTVLALRGKGTVLRAEEQIDAQPKMDILVQDEFITHRASRAKLLFSDDSLLTLSEMSRLVVREYLMQEATNRSRAIYSLLEGKLRAIVGRSNLEIHTPTAVAAARGTGFFVWIDSTPEGSFTGIAVFDGTVLVRSPFQAPEEAIVVEPGLMTIVREGQLPSPPEPTPSQILRDFKKDTSLRFRPRLKFRPPKTLTRRPPLIRTRFFQGRRFRPGPVIQPIRDPSVESLFSVINIRIVFP